MCTYVCSCVCWSDHTSGGVCICSYMRCSHEMPHMMKTADSRNAALIRARAAARGVSSERHACRVHTFDMYVAARQGFYCPNVFLPTGNPIVYTSARLRHISERICGTSPSYAMTPLCSICFHKCSSVTSTPSKRARSRPCAPHVRQKSAYSNVRARGWTLR
jgi:hypothetical protein